MRSVLHFVGWGSFSLCSMIFMGALLLTTPASAKDMPAATSCDQCSCGPSNVPSYTCAASDVTGCATLCKSCLSGLISWYCASQ